MPFPFAFAWPNALHAVRHSHTSPASPPTPFGRLHEYPDDPIAIVKRQIEYTAPLLACIDTVIANILVPGMMASTILLQQKRWNLPQQSPLPLLTPSAMISSSPSLCSFTYSDTVASTLGGSEEWSLLTRLVRWCVSPSGLVTTMFVAINSAPLVVLTAPSGGTDDTIGGREAIAFSHRPPTHGCWLP